MAKQRLARHRQGDAPTAFLAPELWTDPLMLGGDEAGHLTRVLRLGPGDCVRLIDGAGRSAQCLIEESSRRGLRLRLVSQSRAAPPAARLHLAPGFSKSPRRGYLIEKAAELGAFSILFWQAARSQGEMPDAPKPAWTAQAVAGAKQSGALFIPGIETLPGLAALIRRGEGFSQRLVLLEPAHGAVPAAPEVFARPGDTLLVLGPEGGLEPDEAGQLTRAGFSPVSLGPSVLRLETAAVAAMSLWHWARSREAAGP